ncbi:MAG: ABC transporter ATP-binding protein [Candidatus Ranarchaeia archaeon]
MSKKSKPTKTDVELKDINFVEIKDLVKVYRTGSLEVQALRGLSFRVKEGDCVSVMGASGSGKTTLLNVLGGITTPTAGTARLAGSNITSLSKSELVWLRQSVVGHIFQTFNLLPNLTAAENIELPMLTVESNGKTRKERVNYLLEMVKLSPRADHKPDELSGGEKQRVAIAAALANDPPILLADEPTGELDTITSQQVVDFLLQINRELGKTIIMVTHDPNVARQTNRIYRIEDGRIKGDYAPTQAFEGEGRVGAQINIDFFKRRIQETFKELDDLDALFRTNKVEGNEYAQRRTHLIRTQTFLEAELQRLGF